MAVRSRARWKNLSWLLLIGVVFAAALASPLTAAPRGRGVGAHKEDQRRIEQILQSIRSQPWKLLNSDALISAVKEEPSVADARYEANL
ncbi:hypothetical protein ABTI04_19090, partial [Acinetobacter baumannii]